jgi:hypothetical protein
LVIFVDPSLVMRTLSSFNHSGPDEVPIAILLRLTALKASMGIDPIERRPNPGGHPGWVIPHGTTTSYHRALIQGWVELFAKPIILASTEVMGFAALKPSYELRVIRCTVTVIAPRALRNPQPVQGGLAGFANVWLRLLFLFGKGAVRGGRTPRHPPGLDRNK